MFIHLTLDPVAPPLASLRVEISRSSNSSSLKVKRFIFTFSTLGSGDFMAFAGALMLLVCVLFYVDVPWLKLFLERNVYGAP